MTAGRIDRFARTYLAVFRNGVQGQYKRLGVVWVLAGISAFCQGLVIATIAGVAHLADAGSSIEHPALPPGWQGALMDLTPDWLKGRGGILFGTVILSTALLMTSTTARFFASLIERKMARTYHQRMVQDLLHQAAAYQSSSCHDIGGLSGLRLAALQHAIHTSKAFELLVKVPQTAFFFLFFYVVTFKLMWEASAILSVIALVLFPTALYVSGKIHSSADSFFGNAAREFGTWIAVRMMSYHSFYMHNDRPAEAQRPQLDFPVARTYFDGYDDVQLASERMGYVTGMVKAALFGAALATISALVMIQGTSTSLIVAYASALYISFSYLQTLFANLAILNLYYPQVTKYMSIAEAWKLAGQRKAVETESQDAKAPTLTLQANRAPSIPGSLIQAAVEPGHVVDLVSPEPIGKFNSSLWLRPLTVARRRGFDPDEICLFNAAPIDLSPITLAELDGRLNQRTDRSIAELSQELDIGELYEKWLAARRSRPNETVLSQALMSDLPPQIRSLLYFAAALSSGVPFVFLEGRLFDQLQGQRERLCSYFSDRTLFVWRQSTQRQPLPCDFGILLKNGSVVAIVAGVIDDKLLQDVYPKDVPKTDEGLDALELIF